MSLKLLTINGSLAGEHGNTARIVAPLVSRICELRACEARWLHLAESSLTISQLEEHLSWAQAFVFATGTYWDSWGSPLQAFFERATDFEAGSLWLGKPAVSVVTMHSVGGKEVLSRLQGVLTTLGLLIPPMSGLTYSLANHLALKSPPTDFHADLWQLRDLEVLAKNLVTACEIRAAWSTWPIDTMDPKRLWF